MLIAPVWGVAAPVVQLVQEPHLPGLVADHLDWVVEVAGLDQPVVGLLSVLFSSGDGWKSHGSSSLLLDVSDSLVDYPPLSCTTFSTHFPTSAFLLP